jgi:hypothetical protein
MRRWLVGVWALACVASVLVAGLLVVSGRRASDDAASVRAHATSVDFARRKLDTDAAAANRAADSDRALAGRITSRLDPLTQASGAAVHAFDAFAQRVVATDVALSSRIAALNQAVAAANAHNGSQLRDVLATAVPRSDAAVIQALAAERVSQAAVTAALARLERTRQ